MAVIFVSIGVFAAGAFIAIDAPSVGLPLVIGGGIGVVASYWAYLVLEYKHVKQLQVTADYSVTPLPKEIVKLKLSAGFIYPDIKSDAILYFDHKIYSDEGTAAYFGDDLKKAMRVASFVLATIYNIPLDAQLTINVDAR